MIVYVAINTANYKAYIGQTIRTLNSRRNRHHYSMTNVKSGCPVFVRALRKYGPDAFIWCVLDRCETLDELNACEAARIAEFNTIAPNGYNLESGGGNAVPHEITRQKISQANRGRVCSEETRQKLIAMRAGGPSVEVRRKISETKKGKRLSDATRLRMSLGHKGKPLSEHHKRRLSEGRTKRLPVILERTGTGEVRAFPSCGEAATALGLFSSGVWAVAMRKNKTVGGWTLYRSAQSWPA